MWQMQVIGLVAALLLLVFDLPPNSNDAPRAAPSDALALEDSDVHEGAFDAGYRTDAIRVSDETRAHDKKQKCNQKPNECVTRTAYSTHT